MANYKRKPRVCCVLNIAPSYRRSIFTMMDQDSDIDFFFYTGDGSNEDIALMDVKQLSGFMGYFRNRYKGQKLIWQRGWSKVLFKGYDIFILTGNPGIRTNWLISLYARLAGKKVILWTHGAYGNEGFWQKTKNMLYMRMASHLLLYGNYAKRVLRSYGYPQDKMTTIYNSLDYDRQKSLRDKYIDPSYMRNVFGNDFPTITFVGRLTPQKALDKLVEAVGILMFQKVDCNILFMGDGPTRPEIEERIADIGVEDRVWFYGPCYDEEMIAVVLQNSAVTVSPGNVGLTAIHSLTYGIPVVTHNDPSRQVPEFEAIKDGVTGSFFVRGDSVSLSENIEKWLKIQADPTRRKEVKEAAYKMIDDVYNPYNQLNAIKNAILSKV